MVIVMICPCAILTMSRHPRLVLKNVPLHIVQRGNNRSQCFFVHNDYQVYLAMLHQSAARFGCKIHAYVLMTNHVHILATPDDVTSPALMMKGLGERYAQYANRRHARSGSLWQGRYRSCLVETERYFLVCQRYIELNPVRAGMTARPFDHDWSSYRANAHGQENVLITPHAIYTGLGGAEIERQANYRALFLDAIPNTFLEQLRNATNSNAAFGSTQFVEALSVQFGRELRRRRKHCRPG